MTNNQNEELDQSCLELIDETVIQEDGVVNVAVDTKQETVTLDYDPSRFSEEDFNRVEVRQILPQRTIISGSDLPVQARDRSQPLQARQ